MFVLWFAPRNSLTFSKSKAYIQKIETKKGKKEVGEGGVDKNHKIPTMGLNKGKTDLVKPLYPQHKHTKNYKLFLLPSGAEKQTIF